MEAGYKLFRIPKEGIETSNHVKPKFRAPKYEEAALAFTKEGLRSK